MDNDVWWGLPVATLPSDAGDYTSLSRNDVNSANQMLHMRAIKYAIYTAQLVVVLRPHLKPIGKIGSLRLIRGARLASAF
eukprot:51548-Pleurochrysis_carterae.AAC.1